MEASYPHGHNQRCRIQSIEVEGQNCLQFWYFMYGMDVDVLNIYIKTNGQLGKPVWTRTRNQGFIFFDFSFAIHIYIFL